MCCYETLGSNNSEINVLILAELLKEYLQTNRVGKWNNFLNVELIGKKENTDGVGKE